MSTTLASSKALEQARANHIANTVHQRFQKIGEKYKLGNNWQPGEGMRFATLEIGTKWPELSPNARQTNALHQRITSNIFVSKDIGVTPYALFDLNQDGYTFPSSDGPKTKALQRHNQLLRNTGELKEMSVEAFKTYALQIIDAAFEPYNVTLNQVAQSNKAYSVVSIQIGSPVKDLVRTIHFQLTLRGAGDTLDAPHYYLHPEARRTILGNELFDKRSKNEEKRFKAKTEEEKEGFRTLSRSIYLEEDEKTKQWVESLIIQNREFQALQKSVDILKERGTRIFITTTNERDKPSNEAKGGDQNFLHYLDGIIIVGATDNKGTPTNVSDDTIRASSGGYYPLSKSTNIFITAPGENILTGIEEFPVASGASYATPTAASVSLLVEQILRKGRPELVKNPKKLSDTVNNIMIKTTYDNPNISSELEGIGTIDPLKALEEAAKEAFEKKN